VTYEPYSPFFDPLEIKKTPENKPQIRGFLSSYPCLFAFIWSRDARLNALMDTEPAWLSASSG
jgi:hypothetical protein